MDGLASTASDVSAKANDVADVVGDAANSANRMAGNIDEINVSTTNTMSMLAGETHDVASRARGLANDIDSINTKLTASANELERQVHDTGRNLYPIKGVFFYGLLAITAVSVVGVLTGIVLLLFLREISAHRLLDSVSSSASLTTLTSETETKGKLAATQVSTSSEQISRPSKLPMTKVWILVAIAAGGISAGVALYLTGIINYLQSIIADFM